MEVYPEIVLPLAALLGILVGLNWMVYCYYFVRLVAVSIRRGFVWVFGRKRSDTGDTASVITVVETDNCAPKHVEAAATSSS